jgi:YVTN family beta-propeller protein
MRRTLAITLCALFFHAGVSAQDHTIIALSHSDFTAYEVDPMTGDILSQFTAMDQPHEGVVSPDGRNLFVAIPLNHPSVVILDTETFEEKGKVESRYFHRAPETRQLGDQTIINTSALPHGVALNSDGTKLYIGVEWAEVPGLVVYDVTRGRVTDKIELLLKGGHFFAVDHRTDKLYYPHRDDDRVVVLDTTTDDILKVIDVEGGPVGVDFTPDGEAWIHSDYDGSVTVIDMEKDEVVEVIDTGGSGPGRIAVSPDGRYAASTHGETKDVAIIDVQRRAVVAQVSLGGGPGFPLFSPDSQKLYVMNSQEADIVVIDLESMEEEARYPVGVDPFGGTLRHVVAGASR